MFFFLLVAGLVLLAISISWRWWRTSTFSRLGIPGPEPSLIWGNTGELYEKGPIKCHEEWVQKYGRVLGYYYGMKPVLLVTDPMLLKNIFIRDFNKFINRESFNPLFVYNPKGKSATSILNMEGQEWKDVRSILTPTFTTSKMKQMSGSMKTSIDEMLEAIREKVERGEEMDIYDVFQRLSMDIITRSAFGVRTDVQKKPNSKLLDAAKVMFYSPYNDTLVLIGLSFPYLRRLCLSLQKWYKFLLNKGVNPEKLLANGIKKVMYHRRQNQQEKKNDLLQLMMDTSVNADEKNTDVTRLEAGKPEIESSYDVAEHISTKKRCMTEDEITSSAFVVLLAGYETTSTSLAFTSFLLAKHQNIQENLYKEIKELIEKGEKLEYATINKLPYLEKVMNESLRMYPPIHLFTNRYALEDVTYDEVFIPKGMLIQAPVHLMHYDAEFWDDPYHFDPERFSDKPNSNGITFLPFGVGPRNCLGMRFAQLEAKLALAHIIYNFRIHSASQQKEKLDISNRIRSLTPECGVIVKLETRNPE